MTIREFKIDELPDELSSEYGIMRPLPKNVGKKGRKRSFTKDKDKERKKKNRIQSLKKGASKEQLQISNSNTSHGK